jgi:two-component system KDP operon response regulator KdpE
MPEERISVLVVGGDAGLRDSIRTNLSTTGFVFEEAGSGIEATAKVLRSSYHLVLIDLGERNRAGLEICSQLRAVAPNLGIVLVRSGGELQDEIRALEAGADDCVSIPFRFREVVGRLGAVLRRPDVDAGAVGTILRAGEVRIDLARRLCWRARHKIHLSPREFDLLAVIMKHQGRAVTHVKLLIAVWGPEVRHDADYLRSYIKALRRKIEFDPARPEYIVTVPWVGYMFCDPRSRASRQPSFD